MKTIDQINFSGKKALIRVDFNVPLDEAYNITDDNRITAALPTIKKILKDGGSVILMSHLGRPKDGPTDKYSLKHVVKHLSDLLGQPVDFANDCIGEEAISKSQALKDGQVLLLEIVVRLDPREQDQFAFLCRRQLLKKVRSRHDFRT